MELDNQNTSVIYDSDVMVDDTSYGDWLIQQGIAIPYQLLKKMLQQKT